MRKLFTIVCLLFTGALAADAATLEIGEAAPDFQLLDTEGQSHQLAEYLEAGKIVVLEWFNPDCPFIKKHHTASKTMDETFAALLVEEEDIVWLAINSGAEGRQGYGRERNQQAREEYEMSFPILLDEKGEVGRLYGAKTTPHMFIIAADGTLVYQGAIDDNPSPQQLGEINYVTAAFSQILVGETVSAGETKPYGCSVKYAP